MSRPQTPGCALVTGGSRGIGAAIAHRLSCTQIADRLPLGGTFNSDEDGARRVCEEIEEAGGKALAIKADVTNEAEMEQCFEALEKEFEWVSVLVNNAGRRADDLSMQLEDAAWREVIETNLSA